MQCEQSKLTPILLDHLLRHDGCEVHFGWPVAGIAQEPGRVTAIAADGRTLDGRWLIGADGAHSATRRALAVDFAGITYPERFLVASVHDELTGWLDGLAAVNYVYDPVEWCVLLRTPDRWRVLLPTPDGTPDSAELERLPARLLTIHDPGRPWRIAHAGMYRVHQRVAATFRAGRVLLAGDAAHVNNPLGGLGMNSGIHDAVAYAKALAERRRRGRDRGRRRTPAHRPGVRAERLAPELRADARRRPGRPRGAPGDAAGDRGRPGQGAGRAAEELDDRLAAPGRGMIRRENPARVSEIVGSVAQTPAAEVDAVVRAAGADFRRWAATPIDERLALLSRGADAIEAALGELSVLLSRETGKVLGDCRGEIGFAVRYLRWVVDHAPPAYADREVDDGLGRLIRQHKPYGVVAAITPWNAPVILAMLKIAPALAAEQRGRGEAVAAGTAHPRPGRRPDRRPAARRARRRRDGRRPGRPRPRAQGGVHRRRGRAGGRWRRSLDDRLTPAVLELGGNDPAVFLDDAPFDDAAMDRLVMATFATSGQVCMAAKRLYVPAARLPDFVDAYLAAAARVLVTGDPLADGVTMGPVISAEARRAAEALRAG
nr:hypothetical protein GCM10020092_035970 [Actinoplanes digitatis]